MLRKPTKGRQVGSACLIALAFALLSPMAQGEPDSRPVFIKNLTIEAKPGQRMTGSILIKDGVIQGIGAVTAPTDARVIDGKGLVAYAGFIDAWTHLGFAGAKPAEEKREERESEAPDLQAGPPITMPLARRKGLRPSYQAGQHYLPPKEAVAHQKAGFTSALVAPQFGYFGGRSSLVQLRSGKRRELVFKQDTALHGSFYSGGGKGYPSTAMGVMSHLRQFLSDAQHHRISRDAFKRASGGLRRPLYDPDLEFMDRVMAGPVKERLSVFFSASKENEILRAMTLSKEFGYPLVLTGARQAYRHAETIAKRKIPVIGTLNWAPEPKAPKKAEEKKPGKKGPIKGPFSAKAALRAFSDLELIDDKKKDDKKAKDSVDVAKVLERLQERPRVYQSKVKAWTKEVKNLIVLHKAGVFVSFSSQGLKDPGEIYARIRLLIKHGLTEKQAVAALTTHPARLLGVARHLGTLEKGKVANVTILTAALGDKDSRPRMVIVDGVVHDFGTKAAKKTTSAPAQVPTGVKNLTGKWTIDIGNGRLEGTLKLVQKGNDLTGSIETPFGLAKLKGSVKGKTIRFTANTEVQGQKVKLKATGIIKKDKIEGTLSSPMGQDTAWTAKRAPKSANDVTHQHDKPLSGCGCDEGHGEGDDR
ncbi:MAG: amidohydrolase family protein [Planctomycetota bacterium]|nr:amidohydrolase family protein [Planctomycetota bacterium]